MAERSEHQLIIVIRTLCLIFTWFSLSCWYSQLTYHPPGPILVHQTGSSTTINQKTGSSTTTINKLSSSTTTINKPAHQLQQSLQTNWLINYNNQPTGSSTTTINQTGSSTTTINKLSSSTTTINQPWLINYNNQETGSSTTTNQTSSSTTTIKLDHQLQQSTNWLSTTTTIKLAHQLQQHQTTTHQLQQSNWLINYNNQ